MKGGVWQAVAVMAQRFGNNLKAIKVDVAAACKRHERQGGREAQAGTERQRANRVGCQPGKVCEL